MGNSFSVTEHNQESLSPSLSPSPSPPPTGLSPPPAIAWSPSDSSGMSTGLVVGITIASVLVVVLLLMLFFLWYKKTRKEHSTDTDPKPLPPLPHDPSGDLYDGQPTDYAISMVSCHLSSADADSKSTFTYEELKMATDDFSGTNLIGQGGFGFVHRGVLRDGREVAIKQLKVGSCQGEREFQAEVELITRVHHKHLVSLVGYCSSGAQRLLVYEFVPNNTLEFHLYGKDQPTMDWSTRLKIAIGAAKGLAYLHEDCHPKIIHRDIKAANILLDFSFNAKVADFGLAKVNSDVNTHVSTRVMGTFGYLAPEYAASGKLTEKSDVYSFGVMLLELITGHRPVNPTSIYMDDSLVDWARPQLTKALYDGNFSSLVDPKLQNHYDHKEMVRMVSSAAACVRYSGRLRPQMSQIVRALEGDMSLLDLNKGLIPGESTFYGPHGSSDSYDARKHKEDLQKFKAMVVSHPSDEYIISSASEFSERTSEYSTHPTASSSEMDRQITS